MRSRLACALLASGLLFAAPGSAGAQTQTYVDLQGGLGYSTNPLLQIGDGVSSGFARLSAFGYHGWRGERSETSLTAYVENSSYFSRYDDQQLFSLNARTKSQVSEKVELFGQLGFSGDVGGQLNSRFFGPPLQELPLDPAVPPTTDIVIDPDLAALTRRNYRVTGQGGATVALSARDYLSTALGLQRVFFSGSDDASDFTNYNSVAAWQRRVNERFTFGARVIADYTDYTAGRSILTYGPQLTASNRLSEALEVSGAVGFVRTERDLGVAGGKDNSLDFAFDVSLCRNLQYDQLCLTAARRTQSSFIGAAPSSTSINGSYARQLSAADTLQLSLNLTRTDGVDDLGLGRQTFYSVGGSYDRKINQRLSAGLQLTGRKLSRLGEDPKSDVGASVYIRNRFGDVR